MRGLVAELPESGLKVAHRAVWNFIEDENLNFKKSVAAGECDRPDTANHRVQQRKYQASIMPERRVFIEETWNAVMDNPGSCKAIRQFIRVAGVNFIFLPKYSPDLDPIEQMRQTQALVAQGSACFVETICAAIARMLADSYPTNAQIISEFFRPCVNLTAIMHNRARGIKKDATEQHTWEKQKGFGVANHLSIAL